MRKKRPAAPNYLLPNSQDNLTHKMFRVDHAGEMAAVEIYHAQLKVFAGGNTTSNIDRIMGEHEREEIVHKQTFDDILLKNAIRPTILEPIWKPASQLLGYATAFMGEKSAHACTAAVEEVIEQHCIDQEELLPDSNPLKPTITKFREQEVKHKDDALSEGAEQAFAYPILSGIIKSGCKLAIALSQKL